MRIHRRVRLAALVAGLALLAGAVATRLVAVAPRAVSFSPATSGRPLEIDRGAAALWQALLKLDTRSSLLMIVAHPDDEDGGFLTYESRGQGARTALLTLNRGEAGQNLMNSDYLDDMGLLRTEELLASDRYYGVQQYFTRVIDFHFSKSKAESLREWTLERVLYDTVRVVRLVRPLVVASVFVGGPSDGHGNHQVAGEVAQLAFKEAGDPNVFPDQIRAGLRPWAPLKMYARVPTFSVRGNHIFDYSNGRTYPLRFMNYITGKWIEGQLSTSVVIAEGGYDPLLGGTYVQIARQGLGFQKSQNGGIAVPPPGPANSAYHLFDSRVPASGQEASPFAGIDTSLLGIADLAGGQDAAFLRPALENVQSLVEQAMKQFSARQPAAIAPLLAEGAKANLALIARVASSPLGPGAKSNVLFELRVKQAQFNAALADALGLSLRASVAPARSGPPSPGPFPRRGSEDNFRMAIPGQKLEVNLRAADMGSVPVTVRRFRIATPSGEAWTSSPQGQAPAELASGGVGDQDFEVQIPSTAAYTEPYFSRPNVEQPYYNINDPKYLNLPFAPYPVSGWAEFEYQGVPIRIGQVAQTYQRETGLGQVAEPLAVGPAISLWISPHAGVAPIGAKSFPVSVLVRSNVKGPASGTVRLALPPGWASTPDSAPFSFAKDDQSLSVRFEVHPSAIAAKTYDLDAVAEYAGHAYRRGYRTVAYSHLRPYYRYRLAEYRANGASVKVAPSLTVGYVVGTGDEVPESLENLGLHVVFLASQEIASADLSKYNAIVIGERAYSVRPELTAYNQRLLDYVHGGGVLIVQYQDQNYDHNFGPYPFQLGRGETVTEENCAVAILQPRNPALRWPNAIGPSDFLDWVEERGHGFPESWDSRWQPLVEMHDEGQAPQKGGLLIAPYGQGEYVYLALALYRQLPEGVPGSYRLLANLLSLAKNPLLRRR